MEETFLWNLHHLDIADKHRDYLVASPVLSESQMDHLLIGLDSGTELSFKNADPRLVGLKNELVMWIEFSKPFWADSPLTPTVQMETTFALHHGNGDVLLSLPAVFQSFPARVTEIVDYVCGS